MSLQSAATPTIASRGVASFIDIVLAFYLYVSSSDPLPLSSPVSSGVFSAAWVKIFSTKVFEKASAAILLSLTIASVRNGGRRMAFRDVQFQRLFYFSRSSVALQRRTSVVRRRVFSPSPAKARSLSIKTTVGA